MRFRFILAPFQSWCCGCLYSKAQVPYLGSYDPMYVPAWQWNIFHKHFEYIRCCSLLPIHRILSPSKPSRLEPSDRLDRWWLTTLVRYSAASKAGLAELALWRVCIRNVEVLEGGWDVSAAIGLYCRTFLGPPADGGQVEESGCYGKGG